MSPSLAYYDIRGFGAPIRHLATSFEERWLAVKHNSGLDFPNLPYWIDGDVKVTESKAVLRHVARVYDPTSTLLPQDPTSAYKADMLENIIFDAMMGIALFANGYDPAKEEETVKGLHEKLQSISKFLGNNKWITGDKITFVDFWLYEGLIWFTSFDKDFLKPLANFQELKKRFEELPAIEKYMNQPSYIKGPCIDPGAKKRI